MLDFYKNTYYITNDERQEVLELLKRHPEYKGCYSIQMPIREVLKHCHHIDKFTTLYETLEAYFKDYMHTKTVFFR